MRLPNGYGSVYKLSGNRRKPWAVRKTTGWTFEDGKSYPVYRFIGYYATRKEALQALADFNKAPYDLKGNALTFGELFDKWKEVKRGTVSEKRFRAIMYMAEALKPLSAVPVDRMTLSDMQTAIDESGKTKSVLIVAISTLSQVVDYGIKQGIAPPHLKAIVQNVENTGSDSRKTPRAVFSDDDVAALWKDQSIDAGIVLTLLYTGLRSSELYNLTPDDVDLDRQALYIRHGKTQSAQREVPICDRLVPRFTLPPRYKTKDGFSESLKPYLTAKCSGRLLHDTRHTFITWLTVAGVDSRIVKQIVGHKDGDVTSVYTHIPLSAKLDAVNKAFG